LYEGRKHPVRKRKQSKKKAKNEKKWVWCAFLNWQKVSFLLFLVGSVLVRIGSVRCPGSKVCLSMALAVRSEHMDEGTHTASGEVR
jgi:hypothetical protein